MLQLIFENLCGDGCGLELLYLALSCRLFYQIVSETRSLRGACMPYLSAIFGFPYAHLVTGWDLVNIQGWSALLRSGSKSALVQSPARWWVCAHGPIVDNRGGVAAYAIAYKTSQGHISVWKFGTNFDPLSDPLVITRGLLRTRAAARPFRGPVALSPHGLVAMAHSDPKSASSDICMVSLLQTAEPISARTLRITKCLGRCIRGLTFLAWILQIQLDSCGQPLLFCTRTFRFVRRCANSDIASV